jgi:hypothetical protein
MKKSFLFYLILCCSCFGSRSIFFSAHRFFVATRSFMLFIDFSLLVLGLAAHSLAHGRLRICVGQFIFLRLSAPRSDHSFSVDSAHETRCHRGLSLRAISSPLDVRHSALTRSHADYRSLGSGVDRICFQLDLVQQRSCFFVDFGLPLLVLRLYSCRSA